MRDFLRWRGDGGRAWLTSRRAEPFDTYDGLVAALRKGQGVDLPALVDGVRALFVHDRDDVSR